MVLRLVCSQSPLPVCPAPSPPSLCVLLPVPPPCVSCSQSPPPCVSCSQSPLPVCPVVPSTILGSVLKCGGHFCQSPEVRMNSRLNIHVFAVLTTSPYSPLPPPLLPLPSPFFPLSFSLSSSSLLLLLLLSPFLSSSSSSPLSSSSSFTEVIVLFEYEKQQEDELTLKVGEVISNVKQVREHEPHSCSSC